MYSPNPAADARAARLIRYLLLALLTCPLCCACTTTAHRAIRHEHAQPSPATINPSPQLTN